MDYKLIVSDFDGTMLRDDFTVSEEDIAAVKGYVKRGGNFIICTGRMNKSVSKYTDILGLNGQKVSTIGFQGALITDTAGKTLWKAEINNKEAYEIVEKAESLGAYVHIYDFNDLYVSKYEEINETYCKITGITMKKVGKLSDFILKNSFNCAKIMVVADKDKIKEIEKIYDGMGLKGTQHYMSSDTYLEFVNVNAGKGRALIAAAGIMGIELKETISIGDNMNDMSMIEAAGLGVAVENARERLKKAADYVTVDNNHSPIKAVIDKFCF